MQACKDHGTADSFSRLLSTLQDVEFGKIEDRETAKMAYNIKALAPPLNDRENFP